MNKISYYLTGFADAVKNVPTRKGLYCAVCLAERLPNASPDELKDVVRITVFDYLMKVTPRMLLTVFPPTKSYDGIRYECKDYFTTMAAVQEFGLDKPLGDQVFNFLWDYSEPHIKVMLVRLMSLASDWRRQRGEKGLMEEFFDMEGITTTRASMHEVPKPQAPRWWRIIKGGMLH